MSRFIQPQRQLQVRPWPLVIGAFLSLVTARVLFDDVWHGAEITTSHLLSLAAIVVALSSGHYAIPQLKARAIVSGLMLGLLFLGATAYVVISSGARNAEQATIKAAMATEINAQRERELYQLSEAEKMLAGAQSDLARECRSGAGKRCRGIETTIAVYEAAITGHKAIVAKLGPERQANGIYAHMAKTLAAVVGGDEAQIMARLILVMPFLAVLLSELGTITFLHMALGHRDVPLDTVTDAELAELRRSFDAPTPASPPPPPRGGRPMLVVDHPLIAELQRGGPAGSQDELATRLGISKGEVSKTVSELSDRLTVTRAGRCNRIALAG